VVVGEVLQRITSSAVTTALPGQTAAIALTVGSVQTTLSPNALTMNRSASASANLATVATNFT
jgi:hypothetical protein